VVGKDELLGKRQIGNDIWLDIINLSFAPGKHGRFTAGR